jgi:site-specific DNA-cytosine methylase
MKEIRIFDIHSGTGAIKTVLKEISQNLNIPGEVVAMCENNHDLRVRLQYNNPHTKMIIDATNINWDEVPEFNVLTASPPCQDWSTARKD